MYWYNCVFVVFVFHLTATISCTFGAAMAVTAMQYHARISVSIRNFLWKEERATRVHLFPHFILHFYYPIFRFRLEV